MRKSISMDFNKMKAHFAFLESKSTTTIIHKIYYVVSFNLNLKIKLSFEQLYYVGIYYSMLEMMRCFLLFEIDFDTDKKKNSKKKIEGR